MVGVVGPNDVIDLIVHLEGKSSFGRRRNPEDHNKTSAVTRYGSETLRSRKLPFRSKEIAIYDLDQVAGTSSSLG